MAAAPPRGRARARDGDEPVVLARRTGVPVIADPDRARAAARLIAEQCNVIVSDDGLQHHALARDLEICVFDGRGTGNGWLLPAGPLHDICALRMFPSNSLRTKVHRPKLECTSASVMRTTIFAGSLPSPLQAAFCT